MSKRGWDGRVPFKGNSMLEYTYCDPGETSGGYGSPDQWIENSEFEAALVYLGYSKGRSAVRFKFHDPSSGRSYSMPISAFDQVVTRLSAGVVYGRWTFGKQGENYGLYPVKWQE